MPQHKITFTDHFKNRLPLRLHMTLILLATGLSGLLTTRLLLAAGVEDIVIRYPLAVLFSYLMFFLLIKLWLKYLAVTPTQEVREKKNSLGDTLSNFVDVPSGGGSGGSFSGAGGHFAGEGGQFSGAGASGGFNDMGAFVTEGAGNAFAETAGNAASNAAEGTGSAISDAAGDAAGDAVSALADSDIMVPIVLLVAIGAIIASVFGAGVYMISEAPMILSEAAFEFVLAAGLVKSSRAMDSPDWIGSVFRTTWKPFGIALVVAFAGALTIHAACPEVTRISELVRLVLR
ncbi:MAG: hypothetical protein HYS23_06810 [Geobacter sp.]|nr:hypothetical protein [Geobacter sp.]